MHVLHLFFINSFLFFLICMILTALFPLRTVIFTARDIENHTRMIV